MSGEGLLLSLGKIALAVAVGLPLFVYLAQDSLIFYRQPLSEGRHAEISRRFPQVEEVSLITAEGTRLHAWHVKAPGPLVLYFGGNAEEVSWMIDASKDAPGVAWLLMDYRGYGASEGSPSERALVADARMLYDHALKLPGADRKRIYAFGRSLGSGVAVALAAERSLAGLILVTPFDSLAAVAKRHYWYLPVDLMLKHPFDSVGKAPKISAPLLCLAATRDEIIPSSHARKLYDAWAGPKRWVALEEAGHNTTDSHPLFWRNVTDFLVKTAS